MNEPTTSARSVSLPRRSLCQWVDTVTAETSGRVSMKISLRKWKCLWGLEQGPPLSWHRVRTGARVPVFEGADLSLAWTLGDPRGPGRQCYSTRRPFWTEGQSGSSERGGGLDMR